VNTGTSGRPARGYASRPTGDRSPPAAFERAQRLDTEAGSWIFVAGQVGVAIPSDNKPISFEQEARVTFNRIRESLRKLDADMGG
jgi:hypothetical protein